MDPYAYSADGVTHPARSAMAVTPDDAQALPRIPKALYIGTGGHVSLITVDGSAATISFKNLPNGTILPVRPAKVMQTGTTASDIVGLL